MTMPAPPNDLNRGERKAFRKMTQTVAERGIDPVARASLIAELVRLEGRLSGLREAEKQAQNGDKIKLTRAVNVATAEHRRLHADLFRGAAKVEAIVPLDVAVAASVNEADEAWRARLWHGDHRLSHEELEARYGRPSWDALLYRTAAEAIGINRLLDKHRPRSIPGNELQELYAEIGLQPPGPRHHADRLGLGSTGD
ncbi:MAG TPA: hypothetical protein VGX71_27565 [Pseudaminobacter sp.]|nr:hypothetical protein [Pseudaminobacter sp.]